VERIRVASAEDAEAILDIYAPFCLPEAIASFEYVPPSCEEMRKRITSTLAKYPWLVYEVDNKVVGYASASQYNVRPAYDWSVTVSIYLHETARGLGVGRKLYTELFEILRKQNFFNAYAGITIPNPASLGLHKSMGFVEVGLTPNVGYKAGQWLDVALLCLELQPHVLEPLAPIVFPELSGDLLISG
jgi:L-amino acid N-acyltransferase YncA